jgi:hypothetical protein
MAAEFGARGTSAGSLAFHGTVRANPLAGGAGHGLPASAETAQTLSSTAPAETTDPHLAAARMAAA